jgi:hypothetical protein
VADLIDFFPRPRNQYTVARTPKHMPFRESVKVQDELKKWLVRRVDCIRGKVKLGTSCTSLNGQYALLANHGRKFVQRSRSSLPSTMLWIPMKPRSSYPSTNPAACRVRQSSSKARVSNCNWTSRSTVVKMSSRQLSDLRRQKKMGY